MVQRRSTRNKEAVAENGVSNGHSNGKSKKSPRKPVVESDDDEMPATPVKQVNGNATKQEEVTPEQRKRTSSISKPLNERKTAMNASSSVESRGDSLAVLLTQGLKSNDASKIDSVLEKTNFNVIQATLSDLNSTEVVPLLRAIEQRLRTRKALDIRPWIRWAQCCISSHLSFLSSQPSLNSSLGGLLDWMRNRTSNMQKLLALHGKMSIMVEEMDKRRGGGSTLTRIAQQPLVVVNDEEYKSDEEMESVSGGEEDSNEEEDWWDDGGVGRDSEEEEGSDEEEEEDDDDGDSDSEDGGKEEGEEDDDEEEEDSEDNSMDV